MHLEDCDTLAPTGRHAGVLMSDSIELVFDDLAN